MEMYRVSGEIPSRSFTTKPEAEKYIAEWRDNCDSALYIVLACPRTMTAHQTEEQRKYPT